MASGFFTDWLNAISSCFFCFPRSSQLILNGRSLKIVRELGKGGFSVVYLVEDLDNQTRYALKKIHCLDGTEALERAHKEAHVTSLFSHLNIIQSIDFAQVEDKDDRSAVIVYILLPYYPRGNLQDKINENLVEHKDFPEDELLRLMLGICEGLKEMHEPRAAGTASSTKSSGSSEPRTLVAGEEDKNAESRPLMGNVPDETPVADGYVHRDIKPGNIMISNDGSAVIMDFGSIVTLPVLISTRAMANTERDDAAVNSTMSYRAPELFDVKVGDVLDTKADIWSLGCVLYTCLVGKSPFEARMEATGGSLDICIQEGNYRFPDEVEANQRANRRTGAGGGAANSGPSPVREIREPVKEIIRRCLVVDKHLRADVDEVIRLIKLARRSNTASRSDPQ